MEDLFGRFDFPAPTQSSSTHSPSSLAPSSSTQSTVTKPISTINPKIKTLGAEPPAFPPGWKARKGPPNNKGVWDGWKEVIIVNGDDQGRSSIEVSLSLVAIILTKRWQSLRIVNLPSAHPSFLFVPSVLDYGDVWIRESASLREEGISNARDISRLEPSEYSPSILVG